MSSRDMYLEPHECKRSHYLIDGKILNINEIMEKYGIKKNTIYDWERNKGSQPKEFIRLENNDKTLLEYAKQHGKKYIKECEVCGVTEKDKNILYSTKAQMYLCEKHHNQYSTYGCFKDDNSVCVFDPNKYYIYKDIALVECYDQFGNITKYFICDAEDIDIVKSCKWRIVHKKDGDYAVTGNQNSRKAYFHQDVMGKRKGMEVDHINGDTLDNRKCNLRFLTSSQQKINTKMHSNNTSGFRGVSFRKKRSNVDGRLSIQEYPYISTSFFKIRRRCMYAIPVGIFCIWRKQA